MLLKNFDWKSMLLNNLNEWVIHSETGTQLFGFNGNDSNAFLCKAQFSHQYSIPIYEWNNERLFGTRINVASWLGNP